jgi:beta-N-acetylhexosaminidase
MMWRRVAVAAAAAGVAVVATLGAVPAASSAERSEPVRVVPAGDAADAVADERAAAAERVAAMDVGARAASVVMGHIPTTDPARAREFMEMTGAGGFILMGANVPDTPDELRALTEALRVDASFPPLLAIDEEGGDVTRLPWDDLPSARTLKDAPADDTRAAFAARGALVREAGIDVNFGVVADVTDDRSMFIFPRALGTTPEGAADRVSAAVEGEADTVASTLKHFPGHGAAPGDSHAGIPETGMSRDDWRAADAVPFRAGIEAGAPLLMFGHLRYTSIDAAPASVSPEWYRIARDDLGFDGVAITDDLGMLESSGEDAYADPVANAVAAIAAGADMVLAVVNTGPQSAGALAQGIADAVESGALPAERLTEAATRVAALRLAHAAEGSGFTPCAPCDPAS